MANAITYIKNVGKSIGYVSFEALKDINPVFADFAETNGELATDMYKSVRDLKKNAKESPNKVMNSKYGVFGKEYLENLKSDLKTGKFYNKERIEADEAKAYGFDDFGMDFNFDDFDDFGMDDDSSMSFDDEPSTNEMIDIVGEKTSSAISNTMARSAEYIVQGTTESNRAIYNQMNAIYGGIHSGLAAINQNIAKIIEFSNEAAVTHFENSSTFYTEITRMDQERNNYLKEILENVKQINEPKKENKTGSSRLTYSDIVSYDGVLNISSYAKNIKKNLSDYTGIFSMVDMIFNDEFRSELISSPVSTILKLAITTAVPGSIKKSSEKLNKTFSGLFGNALMKIKEKSNDFGILGTIAEIFGINTRLKTKLDTGSYEKGKIPFDGITKKAIIEVIPTYLSKILAALNGRPETRFNYEDGKFVTIDELKRQFDNYTINSANSAAFEIDSVIRDKKRSLSFRNEQEERQFEEDWEALKLYLYKNQKSFNTRDKKLTGKSFGLTGGMASDINVRLFQELLDGTAENARYAHELFKEIDDQNQRMRNLENSGSMSALFNGSIDDPTPTASSTVTAQSKKVKHDAHGPAQQASSDPTGAGGNIDKDSEVARIMKKAKADAPKRDSKSFSEKMNEASGLSAKIAVLAQSATELSKKPAKFIVSLLDKADERLYDLIYGPKDDKNGDKSFVGKLFGGLEKIFNKFSIFLDETIIQPIKKIFTKDNMHNAVKKVFDVFGIDIDKLFKDVRVHLFGEKDADGKRTKDGIFSNFLDNFKKGLHSIFGWVKNVFKGAAEWTGFSSKKNQKGKEKEARNREKQDYASLIRRLLPQQASDIPEAATGMKNADEAKLVVVSPGEAIIPADMNPFNVVKRKQSEKRFKNKLKSSIDSIPEYAEGTSNVDGDQKFSREDHDALFGKMISKNPKLFYKWIQKKTVGMSDKEKAEFIKRVTGRAPEDMSKFADFLKSDKESYDKDDYEEGRNPFHERVLNEFGNLFKSIRNAADAFGMKDEDADKFKDNAMEFFGNIKEHGPTIAAGAAVGAGVSLLTGIVGSPLIGAAAGASIALIKNSEIVQKMLFGDIDKNGERKGGVLSKELSNNIQKYIPDMAKGATIGGILALPFGGPVAGIIVGSALGFAKNNETIQDTIFGDGKLLGNKNDFQKKVRNVLPKVGAGALIGALAGPFGPVTNIMLGSALGFASDTNQFKDLMFGKEVDGVREGGLFNAVTKPMTDFFKRASDEFKTFVKRDMLDPIKHAIAPITKQFQLIGKSISESIANMFKESIGEPISRFLKDKLKKLGGFFGKILGFAMKPLKFVLSTPSRIIGGIGESLRKRQIKRGNADYMSAAQRNAFRRSKGIIGMGGRDNYEAFDEALENVNYEDLSVARDSLAAIRDSRNTHDENSENAFKRIKKEMYSEKNGVKTHIARAALKIVKNGDYEYAIKFVKGADIEESAKASIIAKLTTEQAKMKLSDEFRDNADKKAAEIAENLNKLGFNIDPKKLIKDPKAVDKMLDMMTGEQKYREKYMETNPIKDLNNEEQKRHDETVDVLKEIRDLLANQRNVSNHQDKTDKYQEEFGEISEKSRVSSSLNSKAAAAVSNTKSTVSDIKEAASEKISDAKTAVKETVDKAKGTKVYKTTFGDGNTDYYGYSTKMSQKSQNDLKEKILNRSGKKILDRLEEKKNNGDSSTSTEDNIKRISALMTAMAINDGIDPKRINHNDDPKSLVNKIKSAFKRLPITKVIDGHIMKTRLNSKGIEEIDPTDPDNKEELKKIEEKNNVSRGILSSLTSLPSTLGNIFANLFSNKDDDKKPGLLASILDFFKYRGLGGLGGLETKITLGSILAKALPLALTALFASGKLDNIISVLSGGIIGGKDSNNTITYKDDNGNIINIQTDDDGNPITDANGDYVTSTGKTISGDSKITTNKSEANMTLSERLKHNFARGTFGSLISKYTKAPISKGSIIGNVFKKNKLIQSIKDSKIGKKIGSATSKFFKAADVANIGAMDDLVTMLRTNVDTFIKALGNVPILKRFVNPTKLASLSDDIIKMISTNLPKAGKLIKGAGNLLSKLALPIAIAMAVNDFITGWQDSSTILKIKPEDVKLHHKIICGLVRTFKNLIPVVGVFIPDQVITDLFINHVANWFGIDVSEIKDKREAAKKEMEEAGYSSWTDYNKTVNQQYTWTEKVGNSISTTILNNKSKKATDAYMNSNTTSVSYPANSMPTSNAFNTITPSSAASYSAKGSGMKFKYGRGSEDHQVEGPNFISQVDPKYRNIPFNISGDSQKQTLGDSGCAPAAAAMAINSTIGGASMESASNLALKYKVKDDGVRASYFDEEFSRHGLKAEYSTSSSDIKDQLTNNKKVVIMGQDKNNKSKVNSPFGPNPHYVTATGMSRDGQYVYINDPEASRPNIRYKASKVFGSSKLGVAAARGSKSITNKFRKYTARGTYGPETAQYKVWNALRAKGYNELAVAAAMGNIEVESHFDPSAVEKGSGKGFGLIQWTGDRRIAIESAARQKGVNPANLEFQINYLINELEPKSGQWTSASPKYNLGSFKRDDWAKATDLSAATKAFMCCYERPTYDPNYNHIDQRLQYASQYYEAFTGTRIDTNLTYPMHSGNVDGSIDYPQSNTTTSTTGGFLGEIFGLFNNLAASYRLTDSSYTTSMYNNSGSDDTDLTYNNTTEGIDGNVSSNPDHAVLQNKLVKQMDAIKGTLKYAQGNSKYPGSRNPEDGSGDCSSTIQWVYKKILGVDPGGWTGAQREDSDTFTVRSGPDATKDESWLQLGDLLLKNGHVEMYAGNNTMIGHGGGKDGKTLGPTIKKLDKSGKYDLVRRWVGFRDDGTNVTGSGSGLAYSNALNHISGKGSEPISAPLKVNSSKISTNQYNSNSVTSNMPAYSNNTTSKTSNTKTVSNDMIELVKSIIRLLTQVVTNTAQLNNIVKLLGDYMSAASHASSSGTQESKNTAILAKQSFINAMQNASSSSIQNIELQKLIEESERIAKIS